MARTNVFDDNGDYAGHFNADKASYHSERTRWNGQNHVSLATGTEWDHEELIRTAGGDWVLRRWSQWEGSKEGYSYVSPGKAQEWLLISEYDDDEIAEIMGAPVEEERGPGRPPVGRELKIAIPEETIAKMDALVEAGEARSRAEIVRAALTQFFAS